MFLILYLIGIEVVILACLRLHYIEINLRLNEFEYLVTPL